MKLKFFFFLCFLLSGCATLSRSPKEMTLTKIEELRPGKTNIAEAESLVGKATQVLHRSKLNETWIYRNDDGFQTASLTFDQTGTMTGAVWLPAETKDFISVKQVLSHFKNSKFKMNKEGWDQQGHSYSEDTRYTDDEHGVSFTVNASDQMVMMIGFSTTPIERVPAKSHAL